jgi:hypothetical protein
MSKGTPAQTKGASRSWLAVPKKLGRVEYVGVTAMVCSSRCRSGLF